jgi:gas vesicle protein
MTRDRFWIGLFAGIGIGAVVGGVVALIVAPSSGADLRRQIKDKGRDLVGRARHRGAIQPSELEGTPVTP